MVAGQSLQERRLLMLAQRGDAMQPRRMVRTCAMENATGVPEPLESNDMPGHRHAKKCETSPWQVQRAAVGHVSCKPQESCQQF